ncbi:MAG: hypothetical protein AAF542_22775, partial [Pseudomonadota bacterium]
MTDFTDQQFDQWRQAIGRRQVRNQYLDTESAKRFAVAVGLEPESIPALVHWAWFLEAAPDQKLGPDGHPKRGEFLPAITLPRRMFASSRIQFHQPLALQHHAEISIEMIDLFRKSGSQGELLFAKVERAIRQDGALCNEETQTIVYRDIGEAVALPVENDIAAQEDDEVWTPDTRNLFRFSSVTFNSHRIHYDQRYAKDVEGYPDLIVHGPFTAAKLADFASRRGVLASFEFRGLAPLFQGQRIVLRRAGHEVLLITGGRPLAHLDLSDLTVLQLPA